LGRPGFSFARWILDRQRAHKVEPGVPQWVLDCFDADPDPPDLVIAWFTVATSEQFGRPGLTAARNMPTQDLIRCLLSIEAQRGIARLREIHEAAMALLRRRQAG